MIWDKFSTSLWARAGAQPSVAYQRCPSSWSTSSWLTDSSVWAETSAFLVQKSKSPLAESGERWFWCVVCSHCPGAILTGAEFQGQGFVGFRSPPGDPHSATLLEVNCFPHDRVSYQDFMSAAWSSGENTYMTSRHRVHKEERFLRPWRRTALKRN